MIHGPAELRELLTTFSANHGKLLTAFDHGDKSLEIKEMDGEKIAHIYNLRNGFGTLAGVADYPTVAWRSSGRTILEVDLVDGQLFMKEADV
jgi:hypothetical protein